MEDKLDDLIADYLLDKMDSTARSDFEKRLAEEPQLAARVALEREVATTLDTSSPENQLRANLRHLSENYDSPESLDRGLGESPGGKTRFWWVLVAGVLLLAGLAYWNLFMQEIPTMPLPPQRHLESPTDPPVEDLKKENEAEKNNPIKQVQPIAAAFKPIPKLESYIGAQTRGGGMHFRVDEPQSGATLRLQSGQLLFRISGKLEGAQPPSTDLNVMVFSNNQQNFEELRPLESQMLELKPDGEFLFQKKLTLLPGLYYFIVEERQSGEWLFVDKFLVKA